jgi:hypothetical protein
MRILFDHGTPAPLIPFLEGHAVTKAKEAGWDCAGCRALMAWLLDTNILEVRELPPVVARLTKGKLK